MEAAEFLKKFRRKPLFAVENLAQRVAYKLDDIKKIIPHREPFVLVESIEGIDLAQEALLGSRFIPAAISVFRGHFPEFPVYPGSLMLESVGQMATALAYFLAIGDHRIPADAKPIQVRATKILGADFLEPICPDSLVTMNVMRIYWDGFCARFAGQALVNGKIACIGVAELYIF